MYRKRVTSAPHVVGLDLSLTSTGVAVVEGRMCWANRLAAPARYGKGHRRLEWLLTGLREYIAGADLVVIEGLLPAGATRKSAGANDRAGLWHLVTHGLLWQRAIPYAVMAPQARAKYATGKGNAAKDVVLIEVVKRFPNVKITGNDEADALALAHAGADHLGRPVVTLPALNREALAAVEWPTLIAA